MKRRNKEDGERENTRNWNVKATKVKTRPKWEGSKREWSVCMCVVVTWLARPYRGGKSTLFFLIFPLLLTNPEKWGQFSNPSNQLCLRAGRSCWWRGKERGRETETGSEKANTSTYSTHMQTELSRWIQQSCRSGVSSHLYTSSSPSSIQTSLCMIPRSLLLLLFLLSSFFCPPPLIFPPCWDPLLFTSSFSASVEAVQTQPVSSDLPREHYPTFLLLCLLSSLSLCLTSIYLQLDVFFLLIVSQRIWGGFVFCPLGFL